jgi:hypothetical protein
VTKYARDLPEIPGALVVWGVWWIVVGRVVGGAWVIAVAAMLVINALVARRLWVSGKSLLSASSAAGATLGELSAKIEAAQAARPPAETPAQIFEPLRDLEQRHRALRDAKDSRKADRDARRRALAATWSTEAWLESRRRTSPDASRETSEIG